MSAADLSAFIATQPEARARDCEALVALMQRVSGHPPRLWGRMVGFGQHHYVYDSGREGVTFEIGFASGAGGKGDLSLYLEVGAFAAESEPLLARLGKQIGRASCRERV